MNDDAGGGADEGEDCEADADGAKEKAGRAAEEDGGVLEKEKEGKAVAVADEGAPLGLKLKLPAPPPNDAVP